MARRLLALALIVAATGCAVRRAGEPWQSSLGHAHPLTGRIWDVAAARFVSEGALTSRLAASRFALLGEKHDNADHHRLQARLARAVYGAGRGPVLALEMLTPSQVPAMQRYLETEPLDATGLGRAVSWGRSGWPAWELYAPIVQAALVARAPVVAANLDLDTVRALVRGGPGALPPELVARFGLDRPPRGEEATARIVEIRDSHCGQLPETMIPGMVAAQRARDAAMAEAMLDAAGRGAVLIAGAGHVRRDRGVAALLAAAAPGAPITSVAFVEVDDGATVPTAYAARFGAPGLPFDLVWFTPRVNDGDPCAGMRPPERRGR